MSRLIDEKKLREDIDNIVIKEMKAHLGEDECGDTLLSVTTKIIKCIEQQPTAYDVDKVISNIWDRSELIHIKHNCYDEVEDYIRVTDVTQIVKAGGMGRDEIFDRNR